MNKNIKHVKMAYYDIILRVLPIHLPSNQSVGQGRTKEEKAWKRDMS